MTTATQGELYGNWAMYSPEGKLMCRCDEKRASWYIKRNLAVMHGERAIMLTFKPAGSGESHPFMLHGKANVCVVCGATENLNRHHVVPYQYRKHFPNGLSASASYDVLPICLDHHEEYEVLAQQFSTHIAERYEAPPAQGGKWTPEKVAEKNAVGAARALLKHRAVIPQERIAVLERQVVETFGDASLEDVAQLVIQPLAPAKSHAQLVIEAVVARDELQQFIQAWRQHFVDTMKPQFLSPHWEISYVRR